MKKDNNKIEFIFEDGDIIVLSKPAGVYTIPERYDHDAFNIYTHLKSIYGSIFTAHRLDKDTSGVMVFAKNAESHRNLNMQFDANEVIRTYHVIVDGVLNKEELDIDIPIAANPAKKGLSMPSARGKASLTKLKVLEKFRNSSLCECGLVTGRHHQIRVHCAAIGFPLLIDGLYGKREEFYVSSVKRKYHLKKNSEEKPLINRITMHSRDLSFKHPSNGKQIAFSSEYPRDFAALLRVLRKYAGLRDLSMYR